MTDLADFLLARISEDEENGPDVSHLAGYVEGFSDDDHRQWATDQEHWDRRWAAECDAKRRIVESVERALPLGTNGLGASVMMLLALPYADHPDYREEWKP